MEIGIPNEISVEERRVALTPVGVYALTEDGNTVFVESGAGKRGGFSDDDFRGVGADVVFSKDEVFRRSELLLKVQAPTLDECELLEPGTTLFSFLGLGLKHQAIVSRFKQRNVTALAYEFAEQPDGSLPILTAISEIAGLLLPQIAGRLLESDYGGRGITLGGVSGIAPANIAILGAGVVGFHAARAFSAVGARVLVMDRDLEKLRELDRTLGKGVSTSMVTPLLVERAVRAADVLIGAALIHGRRTPHLVSESLIRDMKPGAVVMDVSIDQGGCIETSRPTTLSSPTFEKHGVIHYCVPNMTASVARTASHALNNAVLPWAIQVSRLGLDNAFEKFSCLRKGIYVRNGKITGELRARGGYDGEQIIERSK